MANDNQATVADIVSAQEDASDAVDAQIQTTSDLQTGGANPPVDDALKKLRKKKTDIDKQAVNAIASSAELAAALKTMQSATSGMNDTAQNMKSATGVINNITTFLGYGTQVVSALQNVSSSKT